MVDSRARAKPFPGSAAAGPLLGLVLLMVALCLPTLQMGLWEDELLEIDGASQSSLIAVWQNMYGRLTDTHPPLSYVILYPVVHFFGANDIAVRLPSLLCGLLLVPAMYWLGRTAHSHKAGLLAAFFAAVSPFANYYACQTRSYSLATLLIALSLVFFCKLMEPSSDHKPANFFAFVVSAAAIYYTEYSAGLFLPALAVALVLISYRDWLSAETKRQAFTTIKTGISALFLAGLLFVPWLPSVIKQVHVSHLMDPPPLSSWPCVFGYCLVMMLPIPAIVGIRLGYLVLFCSLVGAVWHCIKTTFKVALRQLKAWVMTVPTSYIVLFCAAIIPAASVGYIAPFFFGYYRWIYPYSPAGWAALSIICCTFWGQARRARVALALGSILVLNAAYLCWFASRPQSGIRPFSKDALSGKFDNTAFLLVSDIELGPSLNHYLSKAERDAHHIATIGYPRVDNPFAIITLPEIPLDFRSAEMLDAVEKRIKAFSVDGTYKYLVVISELDDQIKLVTTKEIPRWQKVSALRQFLDDNFKEVETSPGEYGGNTESITVKKYKLGP